MTEAYVGVGVHGRSGGVPLARSSRGRQTRGHGTFERARPVPPQAHAGLARDLLRARPLPLAGRPGLGVDPRQPQERRQGWDLHDGVGARRDRHRPDPRAARSARPIVKEPGRVRDLRLLHIVLPRHTADRPALPDLRRPPADRCEPREPVAAERPDAVGLPGGRHRARAELRGIHHRDLPGRDPIRGPRTGRGGRCPGHVLRAADASRGPAPGHAGHHPARRATTSSR